MNYCVLCIFPCPPSQKNEDQSLELNLWLRCGFLILVMPEPVLSYMREPMQEHEKFQTGLPFPHPPFIVISDFQSCLYHEVKFCLRLQLKTNPDVVRNTSFSPNTDWTRQRWKWSSPWGHIIWNEKQHHKFYLSFQCPFHTKIPTSNYGGLKEWPSRSLFGP